MSFNRILVIKLKQPGDVLVSSPVLAALKEAWPQALVSYLVPQGTEEMITDHPLLDRVYVAERRGATWSRTFPFLRELRRARFDLVLELSGGDRGAFYARITGAKERLGFGYGGRAFWHSFCFTRLLPPPPLRMHLVEHNLEILRAMGIEPRTPRLQFFWKPEVETRVQELLASHSLSPKKFVVMHPGAGWRFKCWTPEGYARIIEVLQKTKNLKVVLTGSKAPHEQELVAAILQESRATPINLVGRLTLKELGALIAQALFFFGVDSAPMHLAAAVGTPAVALFGPSGDFNWGPWGEGHLVIKKDWDCLPCGQDGCEGSKVSRCLVELSPEEVLEKMEMWGFGHE
ncbi:MAG: putative lipopolysaccharide heptosyltransferase III [Deltaproteobacteria bacterium]|nr:putative lipopolysaccharide heptosyltransferase III [Deltaproteobacteria bacterium]MBI4794819.1 putative lipopolysaccharide heptosyltransferase III [Deltaproteobacteria bacterium]